GGRRRDAPPRIHPRLVLELPLSARYQKPMANHPIFFDASGRRAARIKVVAWAVGIALLVILVGFATSLALAPKTTGLNLPGARTITPPNLVKRAQKPGLLL